MAWSTPRTWTSGELVTDTIMNAHVRDQLNAIITDGIPTLRVTGVSTLSDDIAFTADKILRRNTSDGSDNGVLRIVGGGLSGSGRGAEVAVYGNEHGTQPGRIIIAIGNVASSLLDITRADGTDAFVITGSDGSATFTSNLAGNAWVLNDTATNGGSIAIKRSGAIIGEIGPIVSIIAVGTNSDLGIVSNGANHLYLESGSTGEIRSVTIYDTTAAADGDVNISSTGKLFRVVSALKYKTDVQDFMGGLAEILRLRPVTYFDKQNHGSGRHIGFIADEVETVLPELVTYGSSGDIEGLRYSQLTAPLVKAVQELAARLIIVEAAVQ